MENAIAYEGAGLTPSSKTFEEAAIYPKIKMENEEAIAFNLGKAIALVGVRVIVAMGNNAKRVKEVSKLIYKAS